MPKNLIEEIISKTGIKKENLRVTLSRLKNKYDLKNTEQAACLYIKKEKININVSSIIDDTTRQIVQTKINQPIVITSKNFQKDIKTYRRVILKPRNIGVPKIKWLNPNLYSLAIILNDFYSYIFIFENALRMKIDNIMQSKDSNWWENKIKTELVTVYKYSEEEKIRQAKLLMIGDLSLMKPLDFLTIGHLEEIIIKYKKEFIPSVFPSENFFTGHMIIVKRVRNAVSHMSPCTTAKDIVNAKNEIDILLQHLSTL